MTMTDGNLLFTVVLCVIIGAAIFGLLLTIYREEMDD